MLWVSAGRGCAVLEAAEVSGDQLKCEQRAFQIIYPYVRKKTMPRLDRNHRPLDMFVRILDIKKLYHFLFIEYPVLRVILREKSLPSQTVEEPVFLCWLVSMMSARSIISGR
jgi:hypothetical protein